LEIARLDGLSAGTGSFTSSDSRRLQNLKTTLADLHAADLIARRSAVPVAVHLLSFDQDPEGYRRTATIGIGPVDTAATVHWHASPCFESDWSSGLPRSGSPEPVKQEVLATWACR
jgi:hypothetical protein